MNKMTKKVQAIEIDGKICVFDGTKCSHAYCTEMGCDFPNCANVIEEYATVAEAIAKYPDLEIVKT